jgi:hypothetical protein
MLPPPTCRNLLASLSARHLDNSLGFLGGDGGHGESPVRLSGAHESRVTAMCLSRGGSGETMLYTASADGIAKWIFDDGKGEEQVRDCASSSRGTPDCCELGGL